MRRRREERKQKVLETIAFIIGFIIFMAIVGRVGYWDLHYEMDCEVVKIVDNVVTLEDGSGHLWEVENTILELGETYTVVFFNNDTSIRTDDEIEEIKNVVDK